MKQRSFADLQLEQYRKPSRISLKLEKIDALVDWQAIFELVKVVDKTQQGVGRAPQKDLLSKVKMLFLQYLYNLSDPELEDQVNDRLSFQKFSSIDGFAKSPARADFFVLRCSKCAFTPCNNLCFLCSLRLKVKTLGRFINTFADFNNNYFRHQVCRRSQALKRLRQDDITPNFIDNIFTLTTLFLCLNLNT